MPDSAAQHQNEVVVVYALPDEQYLIGVDYESGMTASEAVKRSGLPERFPQIQNGPLVLGVFGKPIDPGQTIEPGMRIEICRPLQCDPRELRREMTSHGMVVGQRESGDS